MFRTLAVLIMLSIGLLPQIGIAEDTALPDGITYTADTTVEGYSLRVPYPIPFSPVLQAYFSLPEPARVTVYLRDRVLADTLWIIADKVLPMGRYRIERSRLEEFWEKNEERDPFAFIHMEAATHVDSTTVAPGTQISSYSSRGGLVYLLSTRQEGD